MKVMTLAQERGSLGAHGTLRIEDSVDDVDGPGACEQEDCNPGLEMDVCGPPQCIRPHDGNRGRVEAGKVPASQGARAQAAQLRFLQRGGLAGQL